LEVLEAKRPLDSIRDSVEQQNAREVRDWYRFTFLRRADDDVY
jgi:hypothetical protein